MDTSSSSSSSLEKTMSFGFAGTKPRQTSMTIDVLNRAGLRETTKNAFGGTLPGIFTPKSLFFMGDYSVPDTVWGVRESFSRNPLRGLSTAAVLTNQRVVLYVAPNAHGAGYSPFYGGMPVFDLARGLDQPLVFNSFTSPDDDAGRYVIWEVPEKDDISDSLFTAHGIHGLYAIRIRENSTFYSDPARTKVLGLSYPNESWIRIVAYWWKMPLAQICGDPAYRNVNGMDGINVRTSTIPLNNDDPATVFDDHTAFPGFDLLGQMDEQRKRIILNDNAMWFLSSELPLLTADSPVCPVIGAGINTRPT